MIGLLVFATLADAARADTTTDPYDITGSSTTNYLQLNTGSNYVEWARTSQTGGGWRHDVAFHNGSTIIPITHITLGQEDNDLSWSGLVDGTPSSGTLVFLAGYDSSSTYGVFYDATSDIVLSFEFPIDGLDYIGITLSNGTSDRCVCWPQMSAGGCSPTKCEGGDPCGASSLCQYREIKVPGL